MRSAAGTGGSHGGRRALGARTLSCALLLALTVMATLVASASAYSQRGHEYSTSFPAPGEAPALNHPTGVAVNETTGNIYVVDSGNNRIVVYKPDRSFLAAWGYGVTDGKKEFEVCTVAAECKPGLAGTKPGQLEVAGNIAVDNSSSPSAGDVYVEAVQPSLEGSEVAAVDKFSGDDPTKPVLLQKFTHGKGGEKFEEPNGIAVGPDGKLYVSNEENVFAFSSAVEAKSTGTYEVELGLTAARGFALAPKAGPAGGFYMGQFLNGEGSADVIAKLFAFEEEKELFAIPLVEALDAENSTGVASDYASEDVYVDHGKTVSAFDESGQPIQTFGVEAGTEHISEGTGLTVDSKTGEVLVVDSAANRIDVFKLEEPGHPPRIDELSAAATTATTTTLEAKVDPAGSATEYAFRYSTGAVPPAGQSCELPCVQVPATPGSAGSGFGDVPLIADVKGLAPLTTYHYKLWARNQANPGTFVEAEGQLRTLTETPGETLPDGRQWQQVSPEAKNAGILGFQESSTSTGGVPEAASDGSAITYLAAGAIRGTCQGEEEPAGNRSPEVTQMLSRRGEKSWCSADIDTKNNTAEGLAPGGPGEYHAFSEDLSLALVEPFGKTTEERPPLSDEATERTPYLRHNLTCATAPAGCFQPLANPHDVTSGAAFGTKVHYVAATPDMSHVVLSSLSVLLTPEPTEAPFNLYLWNGGTLKLINTLPSGETSKAFAELGWSEGEPKNVRRAISKDGSRYIWSAGVGSGVGHLYMRDINQPRSVRLDVKDPSIPEGKGCTVSALPCEHARFQIASVEGSVVFFTSNQRLTEDSGASEHEADLYACNVTEEEVDNEGRTEKVPTGCKLTDLTPRGAGGAAGNPQGLVLGASEAGDIAYFVADGPLAGQQPGTCKLKQAENAKGGGAAEALPVATECNLFVVRYDAGSESWQPAEQVQKLSAEDEFDWGRGARPADAGELVSRVSPNGEWLAFMSDRSLTGYDTRLPNNRRAEEVYLYNERTGETRCASCNPTGARPTGVFDTEASGEGIGLLADRPLLWEERWLSGNLPSGARVSANEAYYQSRALRNDGRLFFDSAEGLVSQDKNAKEDPYQYEPAGVGGCTTASETYEEAVRGCVSLLSNGKEPHESIFLDASESGNDVFLVTTSKLTQSDTDTAFDVYDASVCGVSGQPACLPPPAASEKPCESTAECRGATSAPIFAALPTESASTKNNVSAQHEVLGSKETKPAPPVVKKPLTRAQKLTKALKACHKIKKHKKRVACERTARKKYGAKKKAKKATVHGAARRGR